MAAPVAAIGNPEHALDRAHGAAHTGTHGAADHAAHRAGDPVAFVGALRAPRTIPWALPAWGIASSARDDGGSCERQPELTGKPSLNTQALLLTLVFFIWIPWGGARSRPSGWVCVTPLRRKSCRAVPTGGPHAPDHRKFASAGSRFGPARRLVCALRPINDASASDWNKTRIPGILMPGDGEPQRLHYGLEAKGKMRSFLVAATFLMLFATGAAQAKVAITVDKDSQQMTVAVDGVDAIAGRCPAAFPPTKRRTAHSSTFRMEEDHYSKEFDDAPMPHSIFFTKRATPFTARIGQPARLPASHGCVRLSRANAAKLFELVQAGRRAQHHGDTDRLIAGRTRAQSAPAEAVARRAPTPNSDSPNPMPPVTESIRRGRAAVPAARSARADDGYIYPADGFRRGALSGAARLSRSYEAQSNPPSSLITPIAATPPRAMRSRRRYRPRGVHLSGLTTAIDRAAALLLAVSQPAPHRAEHVGIIVGPDPLTLLGSVSVHERMSPACRHRPRRAPTSRHWSRRCIRRRGRSPR